VVEILAGLGTSAVCYANTYVATVGASEASPWWGDVVQGKEFGMRRFVVVFMVLAMLMVAAAPALAVGVSADCGSQGVSSTRAGTHIRVKLTATTVCTRASALKAGSRWTTTGGGKHSSSTAL